MSLTKKAKKLFPENRRMAAKWVMSMRYLRDHGLAIKPWWGNAPRLD